VDVNCTVINWLRAWQGKMKADNGNYVTPSVYKGVITVLSQDPTGATMKTFKLKGAFPTQVPSIPFGSTGDIVSLDVEFSIDSVEVT
jgi:hypothetical protein